MKKCGKCGAVQNDERTTCIDCGAVLGSPLDEISAENAEAELNGRLDNLSEKTEDFYVSASDRILGIISIVLAVVLIVILNVANVPKSALRDEYASTENYNILTPSYMLSAEEQIALDRIGELNKTAETALIGIISLIFAAPVFLFPKIVWYIDTLRYRLWFSDCDLHPSFLALFMYKILKYLLFTAGVILCAVSIIRII